MFIPIILIVISFAFAGWKIDTIGPCPTIYSYDIVVGKGRNDDTNRLYVSTRNGGIYEWTKRGNSWAMSTVKASGIVNLATLELGEGRNDGIKRLYYSEFRDTGGLYEASWSGTSWSVSRIDSGVSSIGLVIGKARPDSITRIYMNSAKTGIWEYTRNGSSWSKLKLSTDGGEGSPAIGDIRNDGINRVAAYGRKLYELSWSGIKFDSVNIDTATLWPDPILIGQLHNDGKNRILSNSNKGRIEFAYTTGTWSKRSIDTTVQRGDILIAALKADGKNRVYTNYTAQGTLKPAGPINEFTWNNVSYDRSRVVDAVSGATASLVAGVGRNDRIMRMYAPHYISGKIYEITNDTPYVEPPTLAEKSKTKQQTIEIINVHNCSNSSIKLVYSSKFRCKYLLTTISGKIICQGILPASTITETATLTNIKSSGIYLLTLKNSSGERAVKKVSVL